MKTDVIMDLVAGYDAYAEAKELSIGAAANAPATSTPCMAMASAQMSWMASQLSAKTIKGGC